MPLTILNCPKDADFLVIGVGEQSSQCPCHLAYRDLAALKKTFKSEVAAGDLVLLKASNAMNLSGVLD